MASMICDRITVCKIKPGGTRALKKEKGTSSVPTLRVDGFNQVYEYIVGLVIVLIAAQSNGVK